MAQEIKHIMIEKTYFLKTRFDVDSIRIFNYILSIFLTLFIFFFDTFFGKI